MKKIIAILALFMIVAPFGVENAFAYGCTWTNYGNVCGNHISANKIRVNYGYNDCGYSCGGYGGYGGGYYSNNYSYSNYGCGNNCGGGYTYNPCYNTNCGYYDGYNSNPCGYGNCNSGYQSPCYYCGRNYQPGRYY